MNRDLIGGNGGVMETPPPMIVYLWASNIYG